MAFGALTGGAVRNPAASTWLAGEPPGTTVPRLRRRANSFTQPSAFPEMDCVRHILPRRIIAAAEQRARSIGFGADRVLIAADAITEEAYLTALAASLGTFYEPLDSALRADCPLTDDQLIQAAGAGLLPLRSGSGVIWVIAPRCLTARRLADPCRSPPQWLQPFRLTSSERLWRYVARHTHKALGRRAIDGLRLTKPLLSNAPRTQFACPIIMVALIMLAGASLAFAPAVLLVALGTVLSTVFLAAAGLRLLSVICAQRDPDRSFPMADERLPIYTIICTLYREATVVEDLVAAIRALDYPPEKLDVKLVVEADDRETRRALAQLELGPPFHIITAPPIGPRTKPKALNVALALAHGAFTAVYDAEDVPEPDQLRRALDLFMAADDRLACVQASLTIDNTSDNWLARMFTAEYAGQFDVILPGLAGLRLPLPLGGSSNHFRTAVLRQVGGWDAYNVTEDADLGLRLCRFGYRSAVSSSATYEEAPARFVPWLKQRTRWYKGWMQTWLVHMRRPGRLLRELGPSGTIALQLLIAGNVLSALVNPLFVALICYALTAAPPPAATVIDVNEPLYLAALLGGYAATIVPAVAGLRRRGLLAHGWILALTPIYWLLLSLAAWRALLQLVYDPQRWEKTEHGLATTSRLFGTRS